MKRDGGLPISWVETVIEGSILLISPLENAFFVQFCNSFFILETRTGEFGTNFATPDAYMGFRTAFYCENLEQMILHFQINNEPFLLLDNRMYVKTPSGKIFEIYEE